MSTCYGKSSASGGRGLFLDPYRGFSSGPPWGISVHRTSYFCYFEKHFELRHWERAMHSIRVSESLTTEARVFIAPVSAVVVSVAKVADRNVLLASPTAHVSRRTRTLCAVYNSVIVIYRVPPPKKVNHYQIFKKNRIKSY